jgi:hypothetical protein
MTRGARLRYGAAFALPVAAAAFVVLSVSNAPIYDEWLWSPLIVAAHTGTLVPAQLWAQQNSHRSVLPSLIALGLAALTGWDMRVEALVSVLLILACQLCVLRLFVRERGVARAAGPFLAASLLLYSLCQVENLLWGFQLSWFLANALAFAMLVALAFAPGMRLPVPRFWVALAGAIGASFSMLFGFAVWPAGFAVLWRARFAGRRWFQALWAAAACACAFAYVVGYQRPPDEHGWFAEAARPLLDVPQFALAVLGSPLGLAGGRWLCELLGAILCAVFVAFAVRAKRDGAAAEPWLGLFAFGAGVAVLIGLGRTAYGVDAAVISRYTTPATAAWIALLGIASARAAIPRPVLAVGGVLFVVTNLLGLAVAWHISGEERDLASRIGHLERLSDDELRRAFTNNYRVGQPGFIRSQVRQLARLKLGPFRSPQADVAGAAAVSSEPSLPHPIVVSTVQPRILGIGFDRAAYQWGDLAHLRVVTTTNTAAVEVTPFADLPVRLPFRLHETALGEFSGLLRIPFGPPGLPPPRMRFVVDVVALGGEGRTGARRVAFDLGAKAAPPSAK